MPFGGRGDDIGWLNDWLADAEAPQSLLLWGPAGRGKSALLVHWVQQLPSQLPRAFVPISIRADTNRPDIFYQALASRLATILGKAVPSTQFDPVAFYKDRVREYLREFKDPDRPCLIVIDGMDEATGWKVDSGLLPSTPPPGLRIVVSARQLAGDDQDRDWLRRLGWNTPVTTALSREVRPLDRNGVADVLHRMGDPLAHLSEHESIVDELYRLTEGGDPLLLSYYVHDLVKTSAAAARLEPEDLRKLKPGFEEFFKNWYDDQRAAWAMAGNKVDESLIDSIFAILGCAMGPLMLADIGAVLERMPGAAPVQVTLTTLIPVERFVIGHALEARRGPGEAAGAAQGFVLSHPRLGEFFRGQRFAGTSLIDTVCAAFRAWGRAAARGQVGPRGPRDPVPRYVLIYHLQHLEQDEGAPLECYRELAEDRWRRAWEAEEGGYRSFSDQMEICWRKLFEAHRADPDALHRPHTGLGGLIRIGLCLSSVRAIGTNIPPNFVAELVRQQFLTARQAILMARFRANERDSGIILTALAGLVDSEAPEFQEIASEAWRMHDPKQQATVILALAERCPPDRGLVLIMELAQCTSRHPESYLGETSLGRVFDFARTGDERLWEAVRSLVRARVPIYRRPTFPSISTAQVANSPPSASDRSLPDPNFSPRAFATHLVGTDSEEAGRLLRTIDGPNGEAPTTQNLRVALQLVFSCHWTSGARNLARLAPHLTAELLAEAIEYIMRGLAGGSYWDQAVTSLLPYLDTDARLSFLRRLIGSEGEELEYNRCQAIEQLLSGLTTREVAEAEPILAAVKPGYDLNGFYEAVADRLSNSAVERICETARHPTADVSAWDAEELVGAVAKRLSEDQHRQILLASVGTGDADPRPHFLEQVAPTFAPDMLRESVTAVLMAPSSHQRRLFKPLISPVAEWVPDELERILAASAGLDIPDRLQLLDLVLPHLNDDRRREVLSEVQGIALEIGDRPVAALTLAALGESPDLETTEAADPWSIFRNEDGTDTLGAVSLAVIAMLPRISRSVAECALSQARRRADSLPSETRIWIKILAALCPKLTKMEGEDALREALAFSKSPLLETKADQALYGAMLLFSPHLGEAAARPHIELADSVMRDSETEEQVRWLLVAFLSVAPHVGISVAAEAISRAREGLAAPGAEPLPRSALLLCLALSSRLSQTEFQALPIPEISDADVDAAALNENDIARFALLGLTDDPPTSDVAEAFLRRLTHLDRASALILLAVVEGQWDETLNLHPAVSGGARARSVLARWGGQEAIAETVAAIHQTTTWWP